MGKQYQIRNGVVTEITPQVAAMVPDASTTTKGIVQLDETVTDSAVKVPSSAAVSAELSSNDFLAAVAHAAMPSATAQESLTTPTVAGQEYTMPADGYLHFTATITGEGRLYLAKEDKVLATACFPNITSRTAAVFTPVSAGSKIKVYYSNATPMALVLIYCNGNAHLAS